MVSAIIVLGRLVKRLRRRPLTAKTRVRFPYRLLAEHLGVLLFFYANSEPQPNAKYSCVASVAIAR